MCLAYLNLIHFSKYRFINIFFYVTYLIIIAIYKQKAFISEILKDEEQLIPQHEQKMYECTYKEHQHLNC